MTIRTLREKALQDVVTSFQRLAEELYDRMPGVPSIRRNLFQSLDLGSAHWQTVTGKSYGAVLLSEEIKRLQMVFQQRHLLAHRQGIVDDDYVTRSGDTTYLPGQRIQISESSILQAADLIEKLGRGLIESARR